MYFPSVRPCLPTRFTTPPCWGQWLACLCLVGILIAQAEPVQPRGLPFIRTYPLDEIGNVPRGLRFGFDTHGRFAVMYDGIYSVLNDSAWVDRMDTVGQNRTLTTVIKVVDGKYFFGGRGTWGIVEQTSAGRLRPRSLVPSDAPLWTSVTPFNELVGTSTGVYFYEVAGVVYWDFARQKSFFFELPRVSACFRVGERVIVSCHDGSLREILPESGTIRPILVPGLENAVVERAARLDETHTLLALEDGRLMSFDGQNSTLWSAQKRFGMEGQVMALTELAENGVAVCVSGKGLFLVTADGALRWTLPLAEFHRVNFLAANEPGVLWVAGESAVYKVFYDSPLTSFGRSLGITLAWPEIARWNGGIAVTSGGGLYEMEPVTEGGPARFRPAPGLSERRANNLAARGPHLLFGNATGVYAAQPDGTFAQILHLENVAAIVFVEPDLCFVIGSRETTALRNMAGEWREFVPRIDGVGNAAIQTMLHGAVWIEMGGDQVARLTLRKDRLVMERINLPWKGGRWTNLGSVGATVVINGPKGLRTYYDEARETLCAAPHLDKLLDRSPYWILHITEDESGKLWATHTNGIVTFTPEGDDYRIDATTFELRNDFYPRINILPGNDIWITAGRSLYHVEPSSADTPIRRHTVLVSVVADQQDVEMFNTSGRPARPPEFSFNDNSLSFRFFSGTYAWRAPPLYEYRLGSSEPWAAVDPSLILRFPKLRDDAYQLEVRRANPLKGESPPFRFPFVIEPPWYRTPLSYLVYTLALAACIVGFVRWTNRRSLERNAALERLVHERTRELEITMEKLGEETRNAATLAERSRLAGEIHDSLQQGLSGTILHLETTMAHPSLVPDVRSELNIIRSMLSYSREEVQQAVWNLESPLLQNSTLGDALRKLAGYINTGSIKIKVVTHAEPVSLDPAIQHNLLRIAQEAITNAVKHAAANLIEVTLESHADRVVLSVTDNGQGFDPVARSQVEGHFGLRGLRSRTKSIKARLEIISSPGAGTIVQVTVPSGSH